MIRSGTWGCAAAALVLGLFAAGCGDDESDADADARTTSTAAPAAQRSQTTAEGSAAASERSPQAETVEQGSLAPSTRIGSLADLRQTLPRFFSSQSPWNVNVSGLPVSPDSDELLRLARIRSGVFEVEGQTANTRQPRLVNAGIFINTGRWTTPIVTDEGGRPTRVFCRQVRCGSDAQDLRTLSIPPGANPDPRYDGWFTVIDRARAAAWDLWRARRQQDGAISFQFVRRWDLNGPGYLAPGRVSARGSGLPLFAGVITADELRRGRVDHALAISLPGPASSFYVQPASSTDGIGSTESLPEGARMRLRPGVRLRTSARGGKRRAAQAILTALSRFGAIVVDRAAVPTLYAQKDVSARLIDGFELSSVKLTDFEVLELGQRLRFPPEATTPTTTSTTGGGE